LQLLVVKEERVAKDVGDRDCGIPQQEQALERWWVIGRTV